jgi:predicted metal-dependent hydrolase
VKYLAGYPAELLGGVPALIAQRQLTRTVLQRYPESHAVRNDGALFDYVAALKARHLRQSAPLAKAVYDQKLHIVRNALGTHTTVSRVQGGNLKSKREIRIASLFKDAPAAFLKMIVVHELAHLKERDHDRAFYALCRHMEPDYFQLEFDVRLWLTGLELERPAPA